VSSLEGIISQSVKELGDLLLGVKGQGQVSLTQTAQRNVVTSEADEVLRPLMDLLDGNLETQVLRVGIYQLSPQKRLFYSHLYINLFKLSPMM